MAGRKAPQEGYQWTCPYCGRSQLNMSNGEAGKENAIKALRTHIAASDGEGHGDRNELPDGDTVNLSEHVVKVDGRQ